MKNLIFYLILSTNVLFSYQWQKVELGELGIIYNLEFAFPSYAFLTHFNGKGFYKSTDNGANWEFVNLNLTKEPLSLTFYENHGWIGTSTMSGSLAGEILYTSDYGVNWTSVFSFNSEIPIQMRLLDTNHLFLMLIKQKSYSIKMSTDKGFNWSNIDNGSGQVLGSFKINNKFYWYGHSGNLKYFENDEVSEINSDLLKNYDIYEVQFINDNLGFVSCNKGKIFKTINKGIDWVEVSKDIPESNRINSVYFIDEVIGWASGYDTIQNYAFVYSTIDGGNSWQEDLKISNSKFYDFTISNNNKIWIRGNNSLLYNLDLPTGINEQTNTNFLIYPNPSTDIITLNCKSSNGFEISSIVIYDIMGVKIDMTEFNIIQVHSENGIRIDASKLNTGVYFVKIGDRIEKFVKL